MKNKWIQWFVVLAVVAAVLVIVKTQMSRGGSKIVAPVQAKAVVAQDVSTAKKEPALALTGSVGAVSEAVVSAKVAGRVASVLIDNGNAVSPGQTLVVLENTDYQNAFAISQANLTRVQATLEAARSNYQRYQSLFDNGALSQKDLEGVKTSLVLAEADVNSNTAVVANAQNAIQNTAICSPIGGVVTACTVKIGQYVAPGTPLLKVEDISSVYAVINIGQDDLAAVKPGSTARVTTAAYSDKIFNGTVELINPVASTANRAFETKIRVANTKQLLRPGMFVNVAIKTGEAIDVMVVPQNALVSKSGLYYVFVADGNKVKRQQVQIGQVLGQMVEIKSGLKKGQKVVLTDVNTLIDQDRVIITSAGGATI